ncbi:MAG: DUF531 domain-containing protein [Archaeoglobaceae archaeon]|nr:DUF531 domain-containing protein [Archaeoglobaceae archaeon]
MISLCLVNTYDKLKLHEIHLRSIARAVPICYAFNFHLALLDFNFWKDERELVERIMDYTTIGEHGKYALKLLERGKLHLIDKIPAHFGIVIATTSKPDESKKISRNDLKSILKTKSTTFLIGLGRKGLPRELLKTSKYHFDVTAKNISLETCTAMGVIATMIFMLMGD